MCVVCGIYIINNNVAIIKYIIVVSIYIKKVKNYNNDEMCNELLKESTGEKLNLKYFENHIVDRYIKKKM